MKKLVIYFLALVMLLPICGCGVEESYLPVDFQPVKCACKIKPDKITNLVMYSEGEWLKYFNPAGSSVDFGSKFLISVCAPSTDVRTTVQIVEILNKDQSMYVKYTIEKGEKMTSTMVPHATVAVDRGYAGCDIAFFDVTGMR
jgi:hypothetical protein